MPAISGIPQATRVLASLSRMHSFLPINKHPSADHVPDAGARQLPGPLLLGNLHPGHQSQQADKYTNGHFRCWEVLLSEAGWW